jgi:UDP-2,3-diacylglucosamine hydrolase
VKSVFIISDVHLTNLASPQGEALLSLIEKAKSQACIFLILGDLFDLWIGNSKYQQKIFSDLIISLKELKKSCRLIYLEGNHDFLLTKFWQHELGAEISDGPLEFEFAGLKIRAEHGDQMDPNDRGYLFLRWLLRTPPIKLLVSIAPSRLVSQIGNVASDQSRKYTDSLREKVHVEKIKEMFRTYAKSLLEKESLDLLVTGHTHIADDVVIKNQSQNQSQSQNKSQKKLRCINLGSWFDGAHFLEITSNGDILNHVIMPRP